MYKVSESIICIRLLEVGIEMFSYYWDCLCFVLKLGWGAISFFQIQALVSVFVTFEG